MKPIIKYQEIDIYLISQEIISTFLTPKFLKESRVIPREWEFSSPPEITSQQGQVTFNNEVSLYARDGEIIFTEPIAYRYSKPSNINVSLLSKKWVNTFNEFNYSLARIGFRSFISFERDNKSNFSQYIPTTLLAPNDLQSASIEPIRGSIELLFNNPKDDFVLKIEDAIIVEETDGSVVVAGAFFSTDFSRDVKGVSDRDKLNQINQFIDEWEEYWELYEDIVNRKFLKMY
jgi:hypothetical protein